MLCHSPVSSVAFGQYPLVRPVVTPRFALSCTEALLGQLGAIAKNNNLHIQVSCGNQTRLRPQGTVAIETV